MRGLRSALVLGGAGFLGSWVVEALLAEGVRTAAVDNLSTGRPDQCGEAELIRAEVGGVDLAGIVRERSVDVVFHLAGPAYVPPSLSDPALDLERSTATTLHVLEELRGLDDPPLLLYASSAAVYGDGRRMPMDEDHPLEPVSPYGVSKLAAEHYVGLYARSFGVPGLSVRLFSLYGPRQRKQVVYDLLCRALRGDRPLVVLGSPEVSRDLVFAEDAARGFLDLARRAPARGEAYNLASGAGTTLGTLAHAVLDAAQIRVPVRFTGQVRPGDPLRWEGDASRARALGVRCETGLEQGLRRTAEWVVGGEASTSGRACEPSLERRAAP